MTACLWNGPTYVDKQHNDGSGAVSVVTCRRGTKQGSDDYEHNHLEDRPVEEERSAADLVDGEYRYESADHRVDG